MSHARKELDWPRMIDLSMDPEKARAYRASSQPIDSEVCTMCGDLCAVKRSRQVLEGR
jgi:phosphomethylpyrimidine synthase